MYFSDHPEISVRSKLLLQANTYTSLSCRFYISTRSLFEKVRDNQLVAEEFNIIFKTHFALPPNTHNGYLNLLCTVAHEVPELGL